MARRPRRPQRGRSKDRYRRQRRPFEPWRAPHIVPGTPGRGAAARDSWTNSSGRPPGKTERPAATGSYWKSGETVVLRSRRLQARHTTWRLQSELLSQSSFACWRSRGWFPHHPDVEVQYVLADAAVAAGALIIGRSCAVNLSSCRCRRVVPLRARAPSSHSATEPLSDGRDREARYPARRV